MPSSLWGIYLSGISIDHCLENRAVSNKYLGSPNDKTLAAELAEKLDELIEDQQVYLRNDLKLSELAGEAGLSVHHLLQVINQHHHKNFYDYINGCRARFAADYLLEHGKTNLTRLAFDAGFNNRMSFNNAFKCHAGLTPTAFIKNHQERRDSETALSA